LAIFHNFFDDEKFDYFFIYLIHILTLSIPTMDVITLRNEIDKLNRMIMLSSGGVIGYNSTPYGLIPLCVPFTFSRLEFSSNNFDSTTIIEKGTTIKIICGSNFMPNYGKMFIQPNLIELVIEDYSKKPFNFTVPLINNTLKQLKKFITGIIFDDSIVNLQELEVLSIDFDEYNKSCICGWDNLIKAINNMKKLKMMIMSGSNINIKQEDIPNVILKIDIMN